MMKGIILSTTSVVLKVMFRIVGIWGLSVSCFAENGECPGMKRSNDLTACISEIIEGDIVQECPIFTQDDRCFSNVEICRDHEDLVKTYVDPPALYRDCVKGDSSDCCELKEDGFCYAEREYKCVQGDTMIECHWKVEGGLTIPLASGGGEHVNSTRVSGSCLPKWVGPLKKFGKSYSSHDC